MPRRIGNGKILDSLAILSHPGCVLKRGKRLIVVSLGRRDRCMTEKITHLGERHTPLGQTRSVFAQIVPTEIQYGESISANEKG